MLTQAVPSIADYEECEIGNLLFTFYSNDRTQFAYFSETGIFALGMFMVYTKTCRQN